MILKKIALTLIILAALILAGGYVYLRYFLEGPANEQTVSGELPATKVLSVVNSRGLLRAIGGAESAIGYHGTKIVRMSPVQSVPAALESFGIETGKNAALTTLRAFYRKFSAIERKVDLEISVPAATNIEAVSESANVWIEGMAGDVKVRCGACPNITATDNTGRIDIEAGPSETHLFIPQGAQPVRMTQQSGFARIVFAGRTPAEAEISLQKGKLTLVMDPDAQSSVIVTTSGSIFDSTRPNAPPATKVRDYVLRRGVGSGRIVLRLGEADLNYETDRPVFVRSK